MKNGKSKRSPVERELHKIERKEEKLIQSAKNQNASSGWKSKLEEKIPENTLAVLKKLFQRGLLSFLREDLSSLKRPMTGIPSKRISKSKIMPWT